MPARIINLILLVVFFGLIAALVRSRGELATLEAEVQRLEQELGGAKAAGSDRIFVKLLERDGSYFGWRLSIPEAKTISCWTGFAAEKGDPPSMDTYTQTAGLPGHLVPRIGVMQRGEGAFMYRSIIGGHQGSVDKLEMLIWDNLDECEVICAGAESGGQLFEGNETVTLLSIRASRQLIDRVSGTLRKHELRSLESAYLFEVLIPPAPQPGGKNNAQSTR